jgi:hypothetical protein
MKWKYVVSVRWKGGALQLTLGISLIITLLCLSMILLGYYHRLTYGRYRVVQQLTDNTRSGLQYLMGMGKQHPYGEVLVMDLYDTGRDSVSLWRWPWGLYDVIVSKAMRGKHLEQQAALVSAMPDELGRSALFLSDQNSPLYVAGETHIRGSVYLPERGVTTGYLEGKGFRGKELIEGAVKKSTRTLPSLDTMWLSIVRSVYRQKPWVNRVLQRREYSTVSAEIQAPWDNPWLIYSSEEIRLANVSFSGALLIQSDTRVIIPSSARLRDVVVMAPEIQVESGFEGSAQLFAEKVIRVDPDCLLKFPSALVLMGGKSDSLISVGRDARVEGLVLITSPDATVMGRGKFLLAKGSEFFGFAYVGGAAVIRGQLSGNLICHSFYASATESDYYNSLIDATLDRGALPEFVPSSLSWSRSQNYGIVKWVK